MAESFTRKELYDRIRLLYPNVTINSLEFDDAIKNSILNLFEVEKSSVENWEQIDAFITYFSMNMKRFWKACGRNFKTCLSKHNDFFEAKMERSDIFPAPVQVNDSGIMDTSDVNTDQSPSKSYQEKAFFEKSKAQRYRDTSKIIDQFDPDAIIQASIQLFRAQGHNDAGHILKKLHSDPTIASDLKKFIVTDQEEKSVSALEGLAMSLDLGFSRVGYEGIRKKSPNFPPYYCIEREKKRCHPEGILANEISVQVSKKYHLII